MACKPEDKIPLPGERRSPALSSTNPQLRYVPQFTRTHPLNPSCRRSGHRMVDYCGRALRKRILGRCQVYRAPIALAVSQNAHGVHACRRIHAQDFHPSHSVRHEALFREIMTPSASQLCQGQVRDRSALARNLLRQFELVHLFSHCPKPFGLAASPVAHSETRPCAA